MNYTRTEREVINTAWTWLENLAEREGRSQVLDEVLRYERRGRNSLHAAKIVLLGSALQGYESPRSGISELHGFPWGCQWVMIFGASLRLGESLTFTVGDPTDTINRWLASTKIAIKANEAHNHRLVEALPA